MSVSLNGTTQSLTVASSVLGSSPSAYTLAALVNGAAQDNKTIIGFSYTGSNFPQIMLQTGASGFGQSTSAVMLYIRNDATTVIHGSAAGHAGGTALDSTWHHVAVTYASGTGKVYVDGVEVVSTGSLTPGTITLDKTGVGCLPRATPILLFAGFVLYPCIYNAALGADEIVALSKRAPPSSVRPQSLVFFPPCIRNIQDLRAGVTITDNGPVSISTHTRIYA